MAEEHTDDLRNVREEDDLTITTSLDEKYLVECIFYDMSQADPRSGKVRETRMWEFVGNGRTLRASVVDGLKSSEDDPDFPVHNEVWEQESEESIGYITDVQIHG